MRFYWFVGIGIEDVIRLLRDIVLVLGLVFKKMGSFYFFFFERGKSFLGYFFIEVCYYGVRSLVGDMYSFFI